VGLFWDNTEEGDQNGTSGNEDGTEYHPWGEDVTKEEAGKEGVPKQGYSA
jgi:hypothetical protein